MVLPASLLDSVILLQYSLCFLPFDSRVYTVSCFLSSTLFFFFFSCVCFGFYSGLIQNLTKQLWSVQSALQKSWRKWALARERLERNRGGLYLTPRWVKDPVWSLPQPTAAILCRFSLLVTVFKGDARFSNRDVLGKMRKRLGKHSSSGYTRLLLPLIL